MKYDFYLAGKWRNHKEIAKIRDDLRALNYKIYCFLDNLYFDHGEKFQIDDIDKMMKSYEVLPHDAPEFREIFENDMDGIKNSENFLLVFPAGNSCHVEIGAAWAWGKKCYAIGKPEKMESAYMMFDKIFPTLDEFKKFVKEQK